LNIKKRGKILLRFVGYLLLFLFLISIIFSIPVVQTRLAKTLTNGLKEDYNTDIVIKRVDLSFLGSVQLKGIEIRDHHKDTLIFVDNLTTSILNAKKIIDNKINLGSVSLEGVNFYLKTYKDERYDNLTVFVDSFDSDTPKDSLSEPFLLNTSNIYVDDLTFKLVNENTKIENQFSVTKGGGSLSDFSIIGPNVSAKIRGLYFTDDRNIEITNFTTDFTYTKQQMLFQNTKIETEHSSVNAEISFSYKREDLQYFTDKVAIKADFVNSKFSLLDLKKLYGEFGSDDVLNFNANLKGQLNNFQLSNVDILSRDGLKIIGDMHFINAVDSEKGFVFDGDLKNVTANYEELKNVLPGLLGKTLPTELKRLGNFTLEGKTFVNKDKLDIDVVIDSRIGKTIADLELTNISEIDNANYKGKIELKDFNIGAFLNDPLFGKVSLRGDVNGTGFRVGNINSGIIGIISELDFNNYVYQNLSINGLFQNKLFNGNLNVNDENFKMRFNGLADFSSQKNKFDFTANITEANLVNTNLYTRDSISLVKGNVEIDIIGNTFDDIIGVTTFTDVQYVNQKKRYNFKRFVITSTVKDNIKTIDINKNSESNDVAQGWLKGDFKFSELVPMTQNALGSIYANYNPHKIDENQFVDFDLNIYNQIVDVFFPEIFIHENTNLRGRINAKTNALKLTFVSPKIVGYENELDSVYLRIDNKSTLYNTHLTATKINTKYYNVKKLNLLNITKNDTLFFKSEFKGNAGDDKTFNMDFFYTFNEGNKSVLGIQESTFDFEENIWKVNPANNKLNKVVFDLKKNEFDFSEFYLKSKEQEITFNGALRDSTYKDLKIDFVKVKLSSFLPPIDSLSLNGVLNGQLDFIQNDGVYSPKGKLLVSDFTINTFRQGDLDLDVHGENSYEKYSVDLTLSNNQTKSISAKGFVDFTNARPTIDLKVALDKFKLNAFSPLGQDILTKIRGEASGEFDVSGFLRNPAMKGELELHGAGLKFPYLNVDYDFDGVTKIRLEEQSFVFEKLNLFDSKYKTRGDFSGSISHQNFENWYLDLDILTTNLLVLDTRETEESLYYGTAFINGNAEIYGVTDNLFINVNAKTNPGTTFVIPLSDIKTVDNYKLIQFNVDKSTATTEKLINKELTALKGLDLNIKLEVTNDATAQVVIDKTNGSYIEGKGTGNLQIEIDTRGKFSMDGQFAIDEGKYEFKYAGLVNKTFKVEKGGTISWNGSPFDADLNLTAVYTTKANPAKLLENFNSSRKIPVNLITKISGGLFNSKQEFDIEIPNVNNTIASELAFKLNDNDVNEKTKQFLSLLALNTFYNPEKSNFNSSTAIIGTTSNAISNVLSDLISSDDGKVQFDLGYDVTDKSDVNSIRTDDLVNVEVGTQISNRVIINGKVGVPVGSKTQSSVVGEVKVEVLLNEKGNFRGVIFNRQNEIQYSNEEEGYTQGVGLSYQVNFNSFSEFLEQIGLKKKKSIKKNTKKDSVKTPQLSKLTNFKSTKKKNKK